MENWDKPSRDHRKQHQRENPSFSSTLLDAIYRSIDEGTQVEKQQEEHHLTLYRETMRNKQKQHNTTSEEAAAVAAEKPNSRSRARKVENWMMEKKKPANEKVFSGRNSLTEFERRTTTRSRSSVNSSSAALSMYSSSTSSSESSSAGGFSSSESESFYNNRPKPIRISVSEKPNSQAQKPNKHENGSGKAKSKALRILYGDLKKSKQPISPGARLASFLNSLFNSGSSGAKKAKVSSSSTISNCTRTQPPPSSSSACSTASSFSRSCLSKTPSTRTGGAKRSVRFCPVSVIVDEDCRPCGHKSLHEGEVSYGNSNNNKSSGGDEEELRFHVMQESRRVEELARDLLKNYQKKKERDIDHFDMHYEDEDDDDDDEGSCCSSDLFELDNLSAIGIERYREELPVYETTHFSTNRAIATGFIM